MPKKNASTLRGIGKMGPAKLHEELKRWKAIKAHIESKYAHMPAMGEKHMYTKDQAESAVKQLEDKIAAKKGGVLPPAEPAYQVHKDEAREEDLLRTRELQKGTVHGPDPGQEPALVARRGVNGVRTLRDLKKRAEEEAKEADPAEQGGRRKRRHRRTRRTRRR
jgi:hypothetical protein